MLVTGRDGTVHKIVGISQRRTRAGARFQCLVALSDDPQRALPLISDRYRAAMDAAMRTANGGWPRDCPRSGLGGRRGNRHRRVAPSALTFDTRPRPQIPRDGHGCTYYLVPMSRVLVLNATSEPIGVVSDRRAVALTLGHKVEVLAASPHAFASERLVVPIPEVVRLRYFVKVPYQRTAPLNRKAVFARDEGRCQYCTKPAESIDHVVPRSPRRSARVDERGRLLPSLQHPEG